MIDGVERGPRIRRPLDLVVALFALLTVVTSGCHREPVADPVCRDCNVVLVSLDTVRADHLSVYGYDRPTSPGLERLAEEAVVFQAFVNNGGSTLPSHATMMTSLHPTAHGANRTSRDPVPEEAVTLAERFREAGFHTAAFVDGGWLRRPFGFAQGFVEWDESGGHFERIVPRVVEWLSAGPPQPFLLFIHTYDAHSTAKGHFYDCPGDHAERYAAGHPGTFGPCVDGRCNHEFLLHLVDEVKSDGALLDDLLSEEQLAFLAARYDGCINYVDEQLEGIFAELRSAGLYDSTIIAVTSDHGEEFGEHNQLLHLRNGWSELSHVPLILKLRDGRFGGQRVPHLASMVDLAPTLLALVDLDAPPLAQGRSLVPTITRNRPVRSFVSLDHTVLTPDWKLVRPPVHEGVEPPAVDEPELFDVRSDPGERHDLSATEQSVLAKLSSLLDQQLAEDMRVRDALRGAAEATQDAAVPEAIRRELESLGYVD